MTKFVEDSDTMAINRRSALGPTQDQTRIDKMVPTGWRYRRFFQLPYYASPQVQLVLVAIVCFLCPGMLLYQLTTSELMP